eukprot:4557870-Amphidinium_carterae.1
MKNLAPAHTALSSSTLMCCPPSLKLKRTFHSKWRAQSPPLGKMFGRIKVAVAKRTSLPLCPTLRNKLDTKTFIHSESRDWLVSPSIRIPSANQSWPKDVTGNLRGSANTSHSCAQRSCTGNA